MIENRHVPHFEVTEERKMAKGWERRVELHEHKLAAEKAYEKVLHAEQVLG